VSTVESPEQPSVGELARRASENVSTLVRAEIELAKTELSTTVKRAGIGGGMLAAAGVVLLFSVPFLFVVIAEVLVAIGLPRWLSYLIVWVLFLIIAAVLALLGRRQLKKMSKPERTLKTAKDTASWARHPTTVPPA
jgi:Putative Actinobacterial Holin-X, holin superfamily III